MKLQDLITEMPWHKEEDLNVGGIPEELASFDLKQFQQHFDILVNRAVGDQQILVGLARDESKCVAGLVKGDRVSTRCVLEFQGITFNNPIDAPSLQVDLVQAEANEQGTGFGYEIYKALLNAGYALYSDAVQYNGGRKLWEKIIRKAGQHGHYVMVVRDGEIMKDKDGQPIKFNGANIPLDQVWGGKERQDTLLVAVNN